jgi:hypothetical protein
MKDAGQSLEADLFACRGVTVKRTNQTSQGCSVFLSDSAGHFLKLPIDGPDSDQDDRRTSFLLPLS